MMEQIQQEIDACERRLLQLKEGVEAVEARLRYLKHYLNNIQKTSGTKTGEDQ
jgi:prefoldin subunit 5